MQEIIVYILLGGAIAYLGYKFFGTKKNESCDNCDISQSEKG